MKKSLLAIALLGAFGIASAQSNVSIYGVVDAGVAYKNDGNPNGSTVGLASGQQSGSRVGFKGTEDLGGGLSAIFALETGFNVDEGTLAQGDKGTGTSRLFGRQAWVGLNGGFGTVKLGRQQTALYYALDQVDPFHINLAGNSQRIFGNGLYGSDPLARTDNTLSYTTANYNGFSGSVYYGFGEQAGERAERQNVGVGAGYMNGPLNVQFAFQSSKTAPLYAGEATNALFGEATADVKATMIGATYDFGMVKAHAAYADNKIDFAGADTKSRNYLLGVSAPVGAAGTVLASWVRNDMRNIDEGKSDMYSVGYTHALSKRTNLYTSYSYTDNEDGAALNSYNNADFGRGVSLFNVGVRHQF